jgi:hypothetical protein
MHYEILFPEFCRRYFASRTVGRGQNAKNILVWLDAVLLALETPGEQDWNCRIETAELCLSALKTTQIYQKGRTRSAESLERAMLNIRAMMIALKQRDRKMALETGRAALALLRRDITS